MTNSIFRQLPMTLLLVALLGVVSTSTGQSKKKPVPADAVAVLWREPSDIASRDLYLGPGGEAMKPDFSEITFLEDRPGGYSLKYLVRDKQNRRWVTKRGAEAQPETVATRIVWAVGYFTEVTYFTPTVSIKGVGDCANVRFEARPDGVRRVGEWKWKKNPFVGTNELQGLKVMMALMNNWDLKDSNNEMLLTYDKQTGNAELQYVISDLGATFGRTGSFISHNRNRPKDYERTKFILKVENGRVHFDYHGKNTELFSDISVDQARWIGNLLARLSDKQIRDAFRAGGYAEAEIELLSGIVRGRINELVNLPKSQMPS